MSQEQIVVSTGIAWIEFTTEELAELARICAEASAEDLEALRFTKFFRLATYASEAAAQLDLAGLDAVKERMETTQPTW
jgi:hypothetical protein